MFALGWAPTAPAQSAVPETELKVAYLFNFAKFTEWPTAALPAGAPLTVCTVGRDTLGEALAQIEGKSVQGRPVKVRRGVRADELKGCQIAFIAADERVAPDLLKGAEAQSVLTLGDSEGFVDGGGIIGLVRRDNRITFDVNADTAHRSGLRLSSQVLKLARSVKGRP